MRRFIPFLPALFLLAMGPARPAAADPAADYAQQAKSLGKRRDAKAWLALADFCERHLLPAQRLEALRQAAAAEPANAQVRARLGQVKTGGAWVGADEAEAKEHREREAKGQAFYGSGWVGAKQATALRDEDRRTEGWDLETRVDTPAFRIYTDKPAAFARRLGAVLENDLAAYRALYADVWALEGAPAPAKVYAFRDRAGFEKVAGPRHDPPMTDGTGGFAHFESKILFVGASKAAYAQLTPAELDARLLQTARHEAVHGFDDWLARWYDPMRGSGGYWTVEGRAEHLAFSGIGRLVIPGLLQAPPKDGKVAAVPEAVGSIRLAEFLAWDPGRFRQEGVRGYAYAWALVHYLFHGEGGRHAAGFKAFLKGAPDHLSAEDLDKALGTAAAGLEPAFRTHVETVFLPLLRNAP